MGALEDYYRRKEEESLAAQQRTPYTGTFMEPSQNAGNSSAPNPAPGGAPYQPGVSGNQAAPIAGGTSGSYAPTSTGAVHQGDRNFLQTLMGQSDVSVDPALQATLPDAGDVAAVTGAQAEYQARHDTWSQQMNDLKNRIQADPMGSKDLIKQFQALGAQEPQKPDILAIQNQSDRARLLNEASAAYQPLISSLLSASQGRGPSAALNYYGQAADDAARRTLGAAASARGTGAQRAALYGAAMRQNAETNLGAARQAAITGAEEQNQARASLNQALAGLTNVYGTQLYGGTQHQQDQNQQAYQNAARINVGIQEKNAENETNAVKGWVDTGAKAAAAL